MKLRYEIWLPHLKFTLQTMSLNYPLNPNEVTIRKYYNFIQNLPVFFPNDPMGDFMAKLLNDFPGVIVQDDLDNNVYPMPINAHDKDEVFVGRIRRDESQENSLNLWIVSDNLRKGAATNAVQIAEYLVEKKIV